MRTLPQRAPIAFVREVLDRAGRHDAGTQAAALSYQGLLSTVPLILLGAAILGFVFAGDPTIAQRFIDHVEETIPGLEQLVGRNLEALVEARVEAGLIAVGALAWTGSSLAGRAAHSVARAFELPTTRWYERRLRSLAALAIIGAAALAGMWLTALTSAGGGPIPWIVGAAVDVGVALLAYRTLSPPGGPALAAHVPGALVLAGTWTALKLLGGWYVGVVVARATAVYGTLAAIVGFLAAASIAAYAFVYGAELSATLAARRDA
jgi:membrane protein